MGNSVVILAAFVLDAIVGEFTKLPHPVQGFGLLVDAFGKVFNRAGAGVMVKRLGGVLMVVTVAGAGYLLPYMVIKETYRYAPVWAGHAVTLLFAYTALSMRGLADSAKRVMVPLGTGDRDGARKFLSMIVGRDTGGLDGEGISRAAVETVAENSSDGVVAPVFFMALGGVPLALMYKAVNTMDSMVGYRDERYLEFGWAAAMLDDVLNFIPARITALYMIIAAWILSFREPELYSASGAVDIMFRDRLNHKSPNSGYPESTMAGAIGVRLGGPSIYFGRTVEKPYIGDERRPAGADCIGHAVKLLYLTGALAALDLAFLAYVIDIIGG